MASSSVLRYLEAYVRNAFASLLIVGIEPMTNEREAARTFQDLIVWRKAHQFVLAVYRLTESFPQREIYGLSHQLRRAAVSIPANIAEGFRKRDPADKTRFMNMAEGSIEECRYYLILAHDLGYGRPRNSRNCWKKSVAC
jgi:four helix bundle protein